MAQKNQVENIVRNKKKFEKPLMIIDLVTQGLFRRQNKLSPQKNKEEHPCCHVVIPQASDTIYNVLRQEDEQKIALRRPPNALILSVQRQNDSEC